MRLRATVKWVVSAALLAYFATPAIAQTPPPPPADAQVGFQRKTQLSPQEQLAEADKHLGRMDQAARAVRKQLETARQQRDVVKSLCLDDKLSQIDVASRSAKERKSSLASAVQRNDAELANHEYTILTVLRQRSEQLTAEANQCIGEEAAYLGDTKVTTTVDPNNANDPAAYPPPVPTGPDTTPDQIANPPVCTSCTL